MTPPIASPVPAEIIAGIIAATEAAAIASFDHIGRGDEMAADRAAVDAMRRVLNHLPMHGQIVVGEGERDDAPMLFIGEEVGTGKGSTFDFAVDPIEGTSLVARAMPDAMSVLAIAPRGGLLHAPDVYMEKIAIGPGYRPDVIDLDASVEDNVRSLAEAKGVAVSQLGICVLDRPRHSQTIETLRNLGVRIHLIAAGDVAGVIYATDPNTGIDMYLGSGGAPEGVLAAAALKCVGGHFQGRLIFKNGDERRRAHLLGIEELDRKYRLEDLVSKDVVFVATGLTNGALVEGVRASATDITTHSLVMQSFDGRQSLITTTRPRV